MDTSNRELVCQRYVLTEISQDQRAADLDWAIGINKKLLKIIGLLSDSEQSQWQNIRANFLTMFFSVGMFSFNTIPQTMALIKVWGNTSLIVDNLITNIPVITCILKTIIPWLYKKVLANIFKEIERDWLASRSRREREVMLKYANISRIMTICGLFSGLFTIVFYFGPLSYGVVPRTVTNLTDKSDSLFSLQTVYFYDTSIRYRYYLTVMSQILGTSLAAVAYNCMSLLFGLTVLHACGQLENLASRFEIMAKQNPTDFQHLLKIHIKTHYRLIRFVEMIDQLFSVMLLVLFGSFAVNFCVSAFELITTSGGRHLHKPVSYTSAIVYIQYLTYFVFIMFIYSWVGENLITQSEAIHTAIYNFNWFILEPRQARQMTLLLIRSQYPLHITAGKLFPITLKTFALLLKTSAGYISCLLAVKE